MIQSFPELLLSAGVEPSSVKVLRHSSDRDFLGAWQRDRAAYEFHQSIQRRDRRGYFDRPVWASCAGLRDGRTVFLGLYRATLLGPVPEGTRCELTGSEHSPEKDDWYHCEPLSQLAEHAGKMVIGWNGHVAWVQNAELSRSIEMLEELAVDAGPGRNPPWTRDELILALDVYMRGRPKVPAKGSSEIRDLSDTLNALGRTPGVGANDTFRNENGVYMKLMNLRRFDPQVTASGGKGLSRGNKDEEVVWNTFASDPEHLHRVAQAIRAQVSAGSGAAQAEDLLEDDWLAEAPEGRLLTKLHRTRERSRKLVENRKRRALKAAGKLECEVCDFDFAKQYGPRGYGFIEAHHTKPVHTLGEDGATKLEDLALLCSNCHRMIHASRPWLSVAQLKELLAAG